jgi:hypothetical protein
MNEPMMPEVKECELVCHTIDCEWSEIIMTGMVDIVAPSVWCGSCHNEIKDISEII